MPESRTQTTDRSPGFYWIKIGGEWTVGEWSINCAFYESSGADSVECGRWLIPGDECYWADPGSGERMLGEAGKIDKVGERIPERPAGMTEPRTTGSNNFPRLGINIEALRNAIERMLEVAADTKDDMGAVNWGDLGVADIEYRLSMLWPANGPRCVVTVEEAAPGCKLQIWLNECIANTFPNTYIECEW